MAGHGKTAVIWGILVNAGITLIKFLAYLVSGSGAMLSEAIHSFADTANQGLLLIGIQRSERKSTAMFPYGFGAERYFFSLLAAMGIFVLGCGVTVYHGIHDLNDPPALHFSWLTVAVLLVSLIGEGAVLVLALRAIWKTKGEQSLLQYLRTCSDATVLAVLFEDSVAVSGVLIASVTIGLSFLFDSPVPDAIGSILIGLMLGAVAVWLALKNRVLILGQAAPAAVQQQVVDFLRAQPSVEAVSDVKTKVLGADKLKFKAEIDFNGRYLGGQLEGWVRDALAGVKNAEQAGHFAREFGERMMQELGKEVDRIEHEMKERFPDIRHVDLETDS
jgi:zinc transporter 9